MKAQAYELIEAIIGIILLGIFLFYLNYEMGIKTIRVTKKLGEFNLDQSSTNALLSLYFTRIPKIKKYYAEVLVDAILQGKFMRHPSDRVFYGVSLGKLNNSELITPLFDKYFGGGWHLLVKTPEGEMNYGKKLSEDNVLFVYTLPVPVPDEKIGNLTLKIGRQVKITK